MKYFTSDTHFNDDRLRLNGRDLFFDNSKEANSTIIERWNSVVKPTDTVYHLGDVSLDEEGLEFVNQLNGTKILLLGNHDEKIDLDIIEPYFDQIFKDGLLVDLDDYQVYLNHYPEYASSYYFNLVGHIHSLWKVQRNMINVSGEAWNFKPISEDRVKFMINAIKNYYDINVFAGELPTNKKTRGIK